MKNLRRNAFYNVLGWLLPTLIFLALTPLMIKRLGLEAFGVVSLIQVVTGYMNVLNFGFSEAITKQVAASFERDRAQAQRVMWVGMQLFAGFGALGAVLIFTLAHWLAWDLLKVQPDLKADTELALRIGAALFLFQMLAEFYRGACLGCQRFDIPNLSRILRISLSALFIVLALYLDMGIAGVMWGTLAGLVIGLVVNVIWMERLLPLRRTPGDFGAIRHEVFHYSKHVFTMRLASMLASNMGQMLLGTLASASSVALYQVPVRAAETGSVFLGRILQVFFPGFAAMDIHTQRERIRAIFKSAFTLQVLVTAPFFLCVVLEGPALLALWISDDFSQAAKGIILIVGISYWISSLTNLPTILALSFNAPDLLSTSSIIRMAVTVLLGYPLVQQAGLVGAAWLLLLAELQAFWVIQQSVRRTLGADLVWPTFKPILIHAAIASVLYALYELWWRGAAAFTPWALPLVAVIHLLAAFACKAAGPEERRRVVQLLSRR